MIHSVANETQTNVRINLKNFQKKCCHQTLIIHYYVSISIEYLVKKAQIYGEKGLLSIGNICLESDSSRRKTQNYNYLSHSCLVSLTRFASTNYLMTHRRIFFLLQLELHIQILQNIFSSTSADGVSTEKSLRKISFRQFNLFDVVRLVFLQWMMIQTMQLQCVQSGLWCVQASNCLVQGFLLKDWRSRRLLSSWLVR